MAKSAVISIVTAGSDVGPLLDVYTDVDCFTYPIQSDVPISDFFGAGYILFDIPDSATTIRVQSKGVCVNYTDLTLT